jgi:hypothetical protein
MMAVTTLPQDNHRQRFWTFQPAPSEFPNRDDFQSYIPDSGATSHFTPVESDLLETTDCNVPIMLADGSTIHATKIGNTDIHFLTDQGKPCTLHLVRFTLCVSILSLASTTVYSVYKLSLVTLNTAF